MKALAVPVSKSTSPLVQQGRTKYMCTASSPSSVKEKIMKFEEKQGGGPPKKPQQPKKAPS